MEIGKDESKEKIFDFFLILCVYLDKDECNRKVNTF